MKHLAVIAILLSASCASLGTTAKVFKQDAFPTIKSIAVANPAAIFAEDIEPYQKAVADCFTKAPEINIVALDLKTGDQDKAVYIAGSKSCDAVLVVDMFYDQAVPNITMDARLVDVLSNSIVCVTTYDLASGKSYMSAPPKSTMVADATKGAIAPIAAEFTKLMDPGRPMLR